MQANRSRDTQPELAVRRILHAQGLRYRVGIAPDASLRRRADIVFAKVRVAIFIDGCFWHGCPEHGRRVFQHNAAYWPKKIASNVARDIDTNAKLQSAGWTVMRFWEHEEAPDVAEKIARIVLARGGRAHARRDQPAKQWRQ
jgi:DNA mismatch endonuclease (patch repair protein)